MLWEVDVWPADRATDHAAREVVAGATELGIVGCDRARTAAGWLIEGELSRDDVERLAACLLADPVTESFVVDEAAAPRLVQPADGLPTVVHVLPRTGVTDPAGLTAQPAAAALGHRVSVRSMKKYWLPAIGAADVERLANRHLANDAIQDVVVGPLTIASLAGGRTWTFTQETIRLTGLDDDALEQLSRTRCLALTVRELHGVRDHFAAAGRDPFEIELETIAQTWSEHCCHKTLSSAVDHSGPAGESRYDNLLKETVFAATRTIREKLGPRDWCVSVFRDNSGVVRFDGDPDICVKVETHNHPSAIEPYGGAAPGLGLPVANQRAVLAGGRASAWACGRLRLRSLRKRHRQSVPGLVRLGPGRRTLRFESWLCFRSRLRFRSALRLRSRLRFRSALCIRSSLCLRFRPRR